MWETREGNLWRKIMYLTMLRNKVIREYKCPLNLRRWRRDTECYWRVSRLNKSLLKFSEKHLIDKLWFIQQGNRWSSISFSRIQDKMPWDREAKGRMEGTSWVHWKHSLKAWPHVEKGTTFHHYRKKGKHGSAIVKFEVR